MVGLATDCLNAKQYAAALGLTAHVLADPASKEGTRRSAVGLREAALEHLPAEEALAVAERWRGRPLEALLAELRLL